MKNIRVAFSMIELIMVIVVMGILSALAMPQLDSDTRIGARDNIYSALQFTRNLALIDNRTNPEEDKWQQELWTIAFSSSSKGETYSIGSNQNYENGFSQKECAIDPANGKYFYASNVGKDIGENQSPNVFLGINFGVDKVLFSDGCSGAKHIAFDNLGRPFVGSTFSKKPLYSKVMTRDCKMIVKFKDTDLEDLEFSIKKETGFVEIVKG